MREKQAAVIWKIKGPVKNYGDDLVTFIITLRGSDSWIYRTIALVDWPEGTTHGEVAEWATENVSELWQRAR